MKKDNITKKLIKNRKKELRHRFFKLSNLKWMGVILLCSVGALVASYYTYKCNPWLSGAFVSAGCGGITGLVLYFLSNLRNNKYAVLQKEFSSLNSISNILSQINNIKTFHLCYRKSWGQKRDIFEDGLEIVTLLEELQDVVDDMPRELYSSFIIDGDNPLSYENLQLYKSRFLNADSDNEVKQYMNDIVKHFSDINNKVFDLKREKEDQIMLLGKYIL